MQLSLSSAIFQRMCVCNKIVRTHHLGRTSQRNLFASRFKSPSGISRMGKIIFQFIPVFLQIVNHTLFSFLSSVQRVRAGVFSRNRAYTVDLNLHPPRTRATWNPKPVAPTVRVDWPCFVMRRGATRDVSLRTFLSRFRGDSISREFRECRAFSTKSFPFVRFTLSFINTLISDQRSWSKVRTASINFRERDSFSRVYLRRGNSENVAAGNESADIREQTGKRHASSLETALCNLAMNSFPPSPGFDPDLIYKRPFDTCVSIVRRRAHVYACLFFLNRIVERSRDRDDMNRFDCFLVIIC